MIGRALSLGAALALALPAGARAQRPHRSGLWGEVSFGPGATRSGCSTCTDITFTGGSASLLRIGFPISDKVLLGLETFGLINDKFGFAGPDTTITGEDNTVTAVVLWYPWRSHVFLQGTMGAAHVHVNVLPRYGTAVSTQNTGVALGFGLGYDLPVSRKFSLTLNAGTHITGVGDITINGVPIDDLIITTYHLALGLTFR